MTHSLDLKKLRLTADTVRTLAMDAVQKSGNGHPGMPMGMADAAVTLWSQFLKHDPKHPDWADRDRFILSAGHGSMLLYALLHLSGYDLSLDDIKDLRQWGSKTPGHPEFGHTVGVETTTGPLGQGISTAVGFAMAERWLAAKFNTEAFSAIDHKTYVIASDGDLQEGVAHEASALAGHLGLGKLIVLWDNNNISIDGPTSKSFTENIHQRYRAYGWHTVAAYGHDPAQVAAAIKEAQSVTDKPTLIAVSTTIGFGSPNKGGTSGIHGSALGAEEVALTKKALGWPEDAFFHVPDEALDVMGASGKAGAKTRSNWEAEFAKYEKANPELASAYKAAMSGELDVNWDEILPTFEGAGPMATRAASGKVLAAISPSIPALLGGSADLTGSVKTHVNGDAGLTADDFSGRYVYYGIREHGMAAIMNGMSLHGGVRPYGGTFFVFSDYLRPAMRLSALMNQGVIYVLTHDSIGLGEDGPTHQPIEHLAACRAMPNLTVIRPANGKETAIAWRQAVERTSSPTALVLSRQNTNAIEHDVSGAMQGGYVLSDAADAKAIIIGTGTEIDVALAAQATLAEKGIATRVVSMPSWEIFEEQDDAYKASVLPAEMTARVSVEAGSTFGWGKYVGNSGASVGIDHFGGSAPAQTLYEKFGITADNVVAAVEKQI